MSSTHQAYAASAFCRINSPGTTVSPRGGSQAWPGAHPFQRRASRESEPCPPGPQGAPSPLTPKDGDWCRVCTWGWGGGKGRHGTLVFLLLTFHLPNRSHSFLSKLKHLLSYGAQLLVPIFSSTFFFCFLGPHPWLGVELELQLPAYTTATATCDPSCVFDLHHSSRQHQILNPLSKARGRTHILVVPSRVH